MTGRALRSIRLALSLTVHEFSERIGIPAAELDSFECGDGVIEPARLSAALERLAPDVETLDTTNPLLPIPPLPFARFTAPGTRDRRSRARGNAAPEHGIDTGDVRTTSERG